MDDGFGLLNVANDLTAFNSSALFDDSFERPLLLKVKRICIDTTSNEHTHDFFQGWKRSLDTVINLGQQTRTEGNREGFTRVDNWFTRSNT